MAVVVLPSLPSLGPDISESQVHGSIAYRLRNVRTPLSRTVHNNLNQLHTSAAPRPTVDLVLGEEILNSSGIEKIELGVALVFVRAGPR